MLGFVAWYVYETFLLVLSAVRIFSPPLEWEDPPICSGAEARVSERDRSSASAPTEPYSSNSYRASRPASPRVDLHTHTHTYVGFYGLRGLSIGVMVLYCTNCMCYCPTTTLHLNLNLALTGDGAFLFSLKKTHSVWFIRILNYGDTENVLINHLLLVIPVIPMSLYKFVSS